MITDFNLDLFISSFITKRETSLLYEDLIKYQHSLQERILGKTILVIGGSGSIGSSYIKAILKFKIKKLVVVDINENSLTELVRDLRSSPQYKIPDELYTYPINFGDNVFQKIFYFHGPFEIVANFAAHKHVRSEKDIFSIEAMIENNVIRARKLLDLLLHFPPEHFFCVSTDKAANPVNIMGASKKLMEELIMAYSDKLPIKTARFANVAFSNGSLPSGFLDRFNKLQPWSCPIGIRRFFVSPQESGELCLIASIIGETGDIFFPKLNAEKDMIPFDQIAIDLLNELGFIPDICKSEEEAKLKASYLQNTGSSSLSLTQTSPAKSYPIYFFNSDTSGEKPFEEFFTNKELIDTESFINLGVVKNSKKRSIEEIDTIIDKFKTLFESNNVTKEQVINILKEYLPNLEHIETGIGLDSKM